MLFFLFLGYLFFPFLFFQLRNKLNQEQNAKLQQQRECLNKRNSEVAVMDKRVNELRDRLWKKKAALQQKENLPVSGGRWAGRWASGHEWVSGPGASRLSGLGPGEGSCVLSPSGCAQRGQCRAVSAEGELLGPHV